MNFSKQTLRFLLATVVIVLIAHLFTGCPMTYNGEKLFTREGCSQCHTFKGKGGRMGPDLSAVTNLRSDSWLDSYIQEPKKINSFARMPSFNNLSRAKRRAIITYLKK